MADTKPQIWEAQRIPVRKRTRNILLSIYSVHVSLSVFVKRQRKNVKKPGLTGVFFFFKDQK